MVTHRLLRRTSCCSLLPWIAHSLILALAWTLSTHISHGQDLSWVQAAMERSKQTNRESLPAWQYDPRVWAGNADATLRDLAVVSADRVYAVGDRGLILYTQDGGRTWSQQMSNTTLNLQSVVFVDQDHGFVVGGTVQPSSRTSVGIVLATDNGGATWQKVNQAALPRLAGIEVIDRQTLRAWGDYSTIYKSGCFESVDQGRSWHSVASPLVHIASVARQPHGLQLAVDHAGRLSQLPSAQATSIRQLAPPTAPVHTLHHTGAQWLAAGDEGTLAASSDGSQWINVTIPLSVVARRACHFRAIAHVDQQVWVGGWPGSILLHSADSGSTWRVQPTEQNWPIQKIRFFDRHRGWAVTEAGSILATRDGGTTWFSQRVPVQRVGLHCFSTSQTRISWPALAESAWQARQATSLSVLHRENSEDVVDYAPDAVTTLNMIGTQIGLVNAELLSGFPLPDARVRHPLLVNSFYMGAEGPTPGQPTSQINRPAQADHTPLVDQLIVVLRMRKPSVVVVDDFSPQGSISGNESTLTEAVGRAMQAAQSSVNTQWLEQELYLPAWRVNKLVSSAASHKSDFTISSDQPLRDSGLSISDVLTPVVGFASLPQKPRISPEAKGVSTTTANASGTTNTLFTASHMSCALRCLQLGPGGAVARTTLFHLSDRQPESTRPVELSKVGNMQLVMGRVHRDKAWQALAHNAIDPNEPLPLWLKKLDSVIEKMPKHEVGPALLQLAELNFDAQRHDRWLAVLERGANHLPLSDAARLAWLEHMSADASDERLAWQLSLSSDQNSSSTEVVGSDIPVAGRLASAWNSTPFESDPGGVRSRISDAPGLPPRSSPTTSPVQTAVAVMPRNGETSKVQSASTNPSANSPAVASSNPSLPPRLAARANALQRASQNYNRLFEMDKSLALRPDLLLAQFARHRGLAELTGAPAPDAAVLNALASSSFLPGWEQMAQQEIALSSGSPTLPIWTTHARRTDQRPRLDGDANDNCWSNAQSIELTSPFNAPAQVRPTTARFAYDHEYLYVLVSCPKHTVISANARAKDERRQYDMLSEDSDYVHIALDTDRDYMSSCELGINQSGYTFDRCCGSSRWNPKWLVDVQETSQQWTAECAIRLSDLTTAPTVEGRAWAISVFRYVPQWDVQSWSQLRSYNPRHQGSGLLLFDR